MKYSASLIMLVFLSIQIQAQDAPTAAPAIKTFALEPDITGAASNSVNLFTGDVALPLNLVSLPGQNGLDVNVSISYNSNVQNIVDTWNLEAPTGFLGLGWSMDIPKIIADHKQTGTREDDTYYLLEGGTSNRLVRTVSGSDANGAYYVYESKNYQFWRIRYYYDISEIYGSTAYGDGSNKWEITKEDGTKYIYGDKDSGRNTLQYTVRWKNWIGSSAQVDDQSQLVHAWNLSEIVSIWNNRITFGYENVEQFVGSTSGKKHTEASYLKEITDANGRKVVFHYKEKHPQFFMEPHTEKTEPDAYQEFYERKYLDHIEVLQDDGGLQLFSIHFAYKTLNSGSNAAKMLLASIVQKNRAGNNLPGMEFEYFASGNTMGFLKEITYPTGGRISYQYTPTTVGHSNRQFTAIAPTGFAEPKVWIAEDYVVVTWREITGGHSTGERQVKLYVYQWVGEWKEQFLQTITSVRLSGDQPAYYDYADFQLVTQKDFFAVLVKPLATSNLHHLFIKYKNAEHRALWQDYSKSIDFGAGSPTLMCGDNFVAVGSSQDDGTHPSYRYIFQGDSWSESTLNQTIGDHYYTASNNFFISHNRQGVGGSAEMNFNYLTEDKKWVTKNWISSLLFSSDDPSYWHSTNSMAMVMADNNPEFIYRWDLTYTNFTRDSKDISNSDLFGQLPRDDYPFIYLINNSMVGAMGRLARFDGKYWHTTSFTTTAYSSYFGDLFTYGDDFVVGPVHLDGLQYDGARREFNPNALTWMTDYSMIGDEQGENFATVGNGYYFFGKHYYFRKPDGVWSKIYSYPDISHLRRLSAYPGLDAVFDVYPYPLYQLLSIKNGQMSNPINITGAKFIWNNISFKGVGLGPRTLVSYPGSVSAPENATSLTLYRFIDGSISGNQIDYPVTKITINDGIRERQTCYSYDSPNATIDQSGLIAQYNEVTITPHCVGTTYGFTKFFFFNGLSGPELGLSYQTDMRWTGLTYRTQIFEADDHQNPISWNNNFYSTYRLDLFNDESLKVDVGYYIRPSETVAVTDGVETKSKNESYDSNTGLVTHTSVRRGNSFVMRNYLTYWWEVYDNGSTPRLQHLLTPVIQTKKTYNDEPIEVSAIRWKNWTCASCPSGYVPGVLDSYVWKRNGSTEFSAWNELDAVAAGEWKFVNSAKLDNKGRAFERTDISGTQRAILWHPTLPLLQADVFNASLDQILYEGFEDCETDCSSEARTGLQGSLATYNVVLPAAGSYTLSYWSKSGSDWTLNVTTISSNTTIGGSGLVIDEVRLHPHDARMVTYAYDDLHNVISVCDENNQIVYTEYDEFNRVKLLRDTDRNIMEHHSYNFKVNE